MLSQKMQESIRTYINSHLEEALGLIRALTEIPAPTHQEGKKAAFVEKWLKENGAGEAYQDTAGNVIWPYCCEGAENIVVFMAHLDVVFEDTTPFSITEQGDRWCAPGIHDDNSNLAALLLCAKYLAEVRPATHWGILIAANVCEEGLGNLKGSRQIYADWGGRIREMISFDGNYDRIVNRAVGSYRYRVTVRTQGGHSYNAFGNESAIYRLCNLIEALYQVKLPTRAKTTFNVGTIQGGTSVNTIPQEASMLYEFRSEDAACLGEMEDFFRRTIAGFRESGLDVTVETLGIRPCGKGVEPTALADLTERHRQIIGQFSPCQVVETPGSTDANTFLAHGIPAVVIGAAVGGNTHTRQEWLEVSSVPTGLMIGLGSVLQYTKERQSPHEKG